MSLKMEEPPAKVPLVSASGRVEVDARGARGWLLNSWRNNFISRLTRVVGWRFMIITFVIYGLDEGGIESLNELGRVFFYKQRGYSPADAARAITWTDMSWNIKPSFALVMDVLPILGYNYRPYLMFWGVLGTAGYAIIAAAPNAIGDSLSVFLFFLGVNAMVWNDTALDGFTMQKIKEFPAVDQELPSYQQVGLMGSAIVFSFFSGFIIEGLGLQWNYAIAAIISLMATVAGAMMPERKRSAKVSLSSAWAELKTIFSLFRIPAYLKMLLYVFIAAFSFDLTTAMVYWYEDVPQFSKQFMGLIGTVGWLVALLAVIVNATFFKGVSFRKLLIGFQLFVICISALDLVLVCVAKDAYWGHFIALSDRAGQRAHSKLRFIVVQVAISEYLPESGETTATALLAAVMNFAGTSFVSTFSGAALLDALGIKRGAYANLPWAILIRTLARFLPIPFIPFLIPSGSSLDKIRYDLGDLPPPQEQKDEKDEKEQEQELARVPAGDGKCADARDVSAYLPEPEADRTPAGGVAPKVPVR